MRVDRRSRLVWLWPLLLVAACSTVEPPRLAPVRFESPVGPARRLNAHRFPRLANQIQLCCRSEQTLETFDELHSWDLAIVDAEIVRSLPEYLGPDGLLRRRNPSIVVLAYFSAADIDVGAGRYQTINRGFHRGLEEDWYLRDVHGEEVLLFPMRPNLWTRMQNQATAVNRYLPRYLEKHVLATGGVDGIFYDWAATSISWLNHERPERHGPLDIDNDGVADTDHKVDRVWRRGLEHMLRTSRELFPEDALILGNAGWNTGPYYKDLLNGIMIEQFLEGEPISLSDFGWTAVMRTYSTYQTGARRPRVSMVMANRDDPESFREMRFALASTLMFDGYFCFTNRSEPTFAYTSTRWYDEYSVDFETGEARREPTLKGYLGLPSSEAFDAESPARTLRRELGRRRSTASRRVWRRDFTRGVVLVNPSGRERVVELETAFRRIRGLRDPSFNDGATIERLRMKPRSGAILLRTAESLEPMSSSAS